MRKHRITKITAVLLALVLCLACMPMAVFAEDIYGPPTAAVDIRSIPGIDYNRITYKATGGASSHPVELKLGDLTFNGELVGSHGLDIEELNEIINAVLKEKGLTVERVALVAKLAGQVEDDAAVYWLDQVIEGLLSYIPSIPGMDGVGINDIWAYVVHGEGKDYLNIKKDQILDSLVNEAEEALNNALSSNTNKVGALVGKIDKATNKVMGATSGSKIGLGAIVNTVKVAKEWSEGSKRFDKYLKDLEQAMADVNDFYSECGRRAEKAAEDKEGGYAWEIRFDKTKNYRTYNATFWGISGVTMQAELSGVLEKVGNDDDVTGEYKGTLWLDVAMVDAESFDAAFNQQHWYVKQRKFTASELGMGAPVETNEKTVLERYCQSEVTVTVSGDKGTQTAQTQGSFNNASDTIEFSFSHTFKWHEDLGILGVADQFLTMTSTDVNKLNWDEWGEGAAQSPHRPQDEIVLPGTVWKPIESTPQIIINFSK